MGLQRRAHLRSLMNKKSGLSERQSFFHAPMARWYLWDICCGFHLGSSCKVKARDPVILYRVRLSIASSQCLTAFLEERGDGLRSKTHEPTPVQAPARLRANVPSC